MSEFIIDGIIQEVGNYFLRFSKIKQKEVSHIKLVISFDRFGAASFSGQHSTQIFAMTCLAHEIEQTARKGDKITAKGQVFSQNGRPAFLAEELTNWSHMTRQLQAKSGKNLEPIEPSLTHTLVEMNDLTLLKKGKIKEITTKKSQKTQLLTFEVEGLFGQKFVCKAWGDMARLADQELGRVGDELEARFEIKGSQSNNELVLFGLRNTSKEMREMEKAVMFEVA